MKRSGSIPRSPACRSTNATGQRPSRSAQTEQNCSIDVCRTSRSADGEGSDAFHRADYDQAIVAWDEAIRSDPNDSEAHRWRGDASLNKGEFDKALSEYGEAIRLDHKNGMAYCDRGAATTGKGEFDKAIASFDEAIRLDPKITSLSIYKRCRAMAESLRPNAGIRCLTKQRGGSDAFKRGDFDQAIVALDEAIRVDPNDSEVHDVMGRPLNKGEFDKALSEYGEAIRLDPKWHGLL